MNPVKRWYRRWYERESKKQEEAGILLNGKASPQYLRWIGGTLGIFFGTFGLMMLLEPVHPSVAVVPLVVGPSIGVFAMLWTGTALTGLGRIRFVDRTENPVAFWVTVGSVAALPITIVGFVVWSLISP